MSDDKKVYRVYSVIEKSPDKDGKELPAFWQNVGRAYPNRDGKGFNIVLEVMPIPSDAPLKWCFSLRMSGLSLCRRIPNAAVETEVFAETKI